MSVDEYHTVASLDEHTELKAGYVFVDTRYDPPRRHIIDYVDADGGVVFIDTDGASSAEEVYQFTPYTMFRSNVDSGRYKLCRTDENEPIRAGRYGRLNDLLEQYSNASGRKPTHKAEALEEALDILHNNIPEDHTEDVDFLSVNGIGEQAAEALTKSGFTTKGDVRGVSRERLLDVPYMGEQNVSNLLEHIE